MIVSTLAAAMNVLNDTKTESMDFLRAPRSEFAPVLTGRSKIYAVTGEIAFGAPRLREPSSPDIVRSKRMGTGCRT